MKLYIDFTLSDPELEVIAAKKTQLIAVGKPQEIEQLMNLVEWTALSLMAQWIQEPVTVMIEKGDAKIENNS